MRTAILWITCLVFACGAHGLEPADMEITLQKLLKDVTADLSSLNQQERLVIILKLKAVLSRSKDPIEAKSARILLVNLGDRETIDDLIAKYKKHNPARPTYVLAILRRCRQSALIPLLAEDLSLEEKAQLESTGDDILDYRRSIQSAGIIRAILAYSPDFCPEVKGWAVAFGYRITGGEEEFRAIIRQWWKENEEHFKKKDYAAVRPPKNVPAAQADGKK